MAARYVPPVPIYVNYIIRVIHQEAHYAKIIISAFVIYATLVTLRLHRTSRKQRFKKYTNGGWWRLTVIQCSLTVGGEPRGKSASTKSARIALTSITSELLELPLWSRCGSRSKCLSAQQHCTTNAQLALRSCAASYTELRSTLKIRSSKFRLPVWKCQLFPYNGCSLCMCVRLRSPTGFWQIATQIKWTSHKLVGKLGSGLVQFSETWFSNSSYSFICQPGQK